jgi:hypothetical protein
MTVGDLPLIACLSVTTRLLPSVSDFTMRAVGMPINSRELAAPTSASSDHSPGTEAAAKTPRSSHLAASLHWTATSAKPYR